MNRLLALLLITVLMISFLFLSDATAAAQDGTKIRVLIVDGQNNHNWSGTTPVLKKILEDSGRFTVQVATTPTKEDKQSDAESYKKKMDAFRPEFSQYDVVLMNYVGDSWSKETEVAFEKFVADGGGLVIYHAANNAFPDWKEYNLMIGVGGWGGRNEKSGPYFYWEDGKAVRDPSPGKGGAHGPQWDFVVDVRQPEHPIMQGMPLAFRHCKDELYDRLRGPAENVTILATAFADKQQGGTGRHEPMLMVIEYKKGRVFHHCLGHDIPQCRSLSFIAPLLRGTEWTATGAVTIPVLPNMPGTDKPKFIE